ncbi:hypothetical protein LXL04_010634 [Taraxacum kok-saghyz]
MEETVRVRRITTWDSRRAILGALLEHFRSISSLGELGRQLISWTTWKKQEHIHKGPEFKTSRGAVRTHRSSREKISPHQSFTRGLTRAYVLLGTPHPDGLLKPDASRPRLDSNTGPPRGRADELTNQPSDHSVKTADQISLLANQQITQVSIIRMSNDRELMEAADHASNVLVLRAQKIAMLPATTSDNRWWDGRGYDTAIGSGKGKWKV